MTEALAGMNITDMHFDRRNLHREQRVVKGDRCMRLSAGIDDDAGGLFGMGFVNEVD